MNVGPGIGSRLTQNAAPMMYWDLESFTTAKTNELG